MCDKDGNARFRKDCKHIILLEWEDGQLSWEDPRLFDGDLHEVTVAVCTVKTNSYSILSGVDIAAWLDARKRSGA